MQTTVEQLELLLLVAAVVAILARRLHLPYTVGLVIAGFALGFVTIVPEIRLTSSLVYSILLPPLIFEAAIAIDWTRLRRDLALILVLAIVGVLATAAVTAWGMRAIAGWAWAPAVLLAVIISPTDPVSVIATFKDAHVGGRLRLLVESESLLNDGVAALVFVSALAWVQTGHVDPAAGAAAIVVAIVGGLASGLAVAGAMLVLAGRTEDHLVEITFTTVAAYGSFFVAQHWHASGILAALTAGLLVGNLGFRRAFSSRGRESVVAFWEYAAFAANAIVFLLIGMRVAHQDFAAQLLAIAVAVALVVAGRGVTVYGCGALFARTKLRVPRAHEHVLFWAAPRGALTLALALGLPATVPQRSAVVVVAFAVVAVSVVVQGLTIAPLMRRLGLAHVGRGAPAPAGPA